MPKVLITGAAGVVGTFLREGLPEQGWEVRCLDLVPGEGDWITGDIQDPRTLDAACAGMDAVIHLAGSSLEAPFETILNANLDGTYQVLEAVRRAGIRRFVYASSNHAIGFTERAQPLTTDVRPRPDTYYGVSKVFGEAMCSLYADKAGLEAVAIRIGTCFPKPKTARMLGLWLSPGDAVRLFHAALTAPDVHYELVYGVSDNTRGWFDLEPARRLGYKPQDDAEVFAAEFDPLEETDPEHTHAGGAWTTFDFGVQGH